MNETDNNPDFREVQVEIREAKPKDAKSIAALRKATWINTYPNEEHNITREDVEAKDFDSEKQIAKLEKHISISDGTAQTWVAKDGEDLLGYCTATKQGQNEIRAIYVHPDYQGKGVGKKLMDQALAWLGKEENAHLFVADYNQETIEFYERLGFEKTDAPVPQGYEVNGKPIPLVEMTKTNKTAN